MMMSPKWKTLSKRIDRFFVNHKIGQYLRYCSHFWLTVETAEARVKTQQCPISGPRSRFPSHFKPSASSIPSPISSVPSPISHLLNPIFHLILHPVYYLISLWSNLPSHFPPYPLSPFPTRLPSRLLSHLSSISYTFFGSTIKVLTYLPFFFYNSDALTHCLIWIFPALYNVVRPPTTHA